MTSLRITASVNAVAGVVVGSKFRGAVLVGGSAASSAIIFDATTQTGIPILTIAAPAGNSRPIMFPNESGLQFNVGCSITITGAGAELYLFLN